MKKLRTLGKVVVGGMIIEQICSLNKKVKKKKLY
jgi:hypothetical protein